MEHLVFRNPALNNLKLDRIETIDLRKMKILSEHKVGNVPPAFALSEDGQPRSVHVGDLVWLMQTGYGVIGTLRVTRVDPIVEVTSHADIDTLKAKHSELEATYWEAFREKLPNLNGKVMYFASVGTAFERQFSEAEQFRLDVPRGYQQSWVVLKDEAKKAKLFSKRGQAVSAALAEEESGGAYGDITPKIRLLVARIWKDECFGTPLSGEARHCDHFVPRALGGPGIYVENVVPVPASINLAKQHFVVPELAEVAHTWQLLTDDEYVSWGEMFDDKKAIVSRQRELTQRITAALRVRPRDEQRRFYFQVLEKGVGSRVRSLFAAAGALPPNV